MDNFSKHPSEEVDLGYLFNRIGRFLKKCVKALFLIIAFFIKYIIIIVVLIVIGFGLGYYVDNYSKENYINEVIVVPNFESTDYLYAKVDALNAKISLKDEDYLKTAIGPHFKSLQEVKIEPIIDVYRFVSKSKENIDIFKTLSENQDMKEFLEESITSKNYKYHRITFVIKGENSKEIIGAILKSFNDNQHFKKYQAVAQKNTQIQISENTETVAEIDSILKSMAASLAQKADSPVFINASGELYDFLKRKQELLNERLELQKQQIDQSEIIKKVSGSYNIVDLETIRISKKIVYPFLLVLLFCGVFFAIFSYKKLKHIAKEK
ncbi:MAG TPA: hypothetical protein VFM65_11260 [Flavobacteriaceae bacterium]|nr:hypothetical protein [Flavobacteriaceae bacterium]